MADTPDIKSLQALQTEVKSTTSDLKGLDTVARTVFERNFPMYIRRGQAAWEEALRASDKAMQARLDSMSVKLLSTVAGTSKEGTAAFVDMAGTHAATYTKSLLGGIESGLSFGLPRILGPLALVLGPINQISAVQAENAKVAASWGSAYGNVLPGQIKATTDKIQHINLQMVQMGNKYRQSKEDILATSTALARNTMVDKEANLATTGRIAALARLHDIPMADLTSQMVDLTKTLNVELSKTPEIYGDIADYATKASMGTQFLISTSLSLAMTLAKQGANFQDFAGFIATATTNLEKLGMSERVAQQAASGAISGLAGAGQGVGMVVGGNLMKDILQKSAGGKEGELPQNIKDALRQVAAAGNYGQEVDLKTAIQMVSKDKLLQSYLPEFAGGTDMYREAAKTTARQLNPAGGSINPMVMKMVGANNVHEYLAIMNGGKGFAGGQTGMGADERKAAGKPEVVANEIAQQQFSYYELMVNKLNEIKTDTHWLVPLAVAGGTLAAAQIGVQLWNIRTLLAQRALDYRKFGGGEGDTPPGFEPGGQTIHTGPGGGPGGVKPGKGFFGSPGSRAGLAVGAMAGIPAGISAVEQATSGKPYAEGRSLLSIGGGAAAAGGMTLLAGGTLAAAAPAAVAAAAIAAVPLILKAGNLGVQLGNEWGATQYALGQQRADTGSKAQGVLSRKLGFDFSAIPEKDRDLAATAYLNIQTSAQRGKKVDVKSLSEALMENTDTTQRILDELTKASKSVKGGEGITIGDPTTGNTTTISVVALGEALRSIGELGANNPHGSTGGRKEIIV